MFCDGVFSCAKAAAQNAMDTSSRRHTVMTFFIVVPS
jgi:hypothetical protein